MSTLIKTAREGKTTKEMEIVAQKEQVDIELIRKGVAKACVGNSVVLKS